MKYLYTDVLRDVSKLYHVLNKDNRDLEVYLKNLVTGKTGEYVAQYYFNNCVSNAKVLASSEPMDKNGDTDFVLQIDDKQHTVEVKSAARYLESADFKYGISIKNRGALNRDLYILVILRTNENYYSNQKKLLSNGKDTPWETVAENIELYIRQLLSDVKIMIPVSREDFEDNYCLSQDKMQYTRKHELLQHCCCLNTNVYWVPDTVTRPLKYERPL